MATAERCPLWTAIRTCASATVAQEVAVLEGLPQVCSRQRLGSCTWSLNMVGEVEIICWVVQVIAAVSRARAFIRLALEKRQLYNYMDAVVPSKDTLKYVLVF